MLVPGAQHRTFQNDHCDESSYHLLLYRDIPLLLIVFPVLCLSSPWLIFVTVRFYLLMRDIYFNLFQA